MQENDHNQANVYTGLQTTKISGIAADTLKGLSSTPKYLLSKYFYDDLGSAIFQDIMNMPEYYLTQCEYEIFSAHKKEIVDSFVAGIDGFDLIELGAGDGMKTEILLKQIKDRSIYAQYIPIDISAGANAQLVEKLTGKIPGLMIYPITGDYFRELKKLNGHSGRRKIILFLGANIGNFNDDETTMFLDHVSRLTVSGDKVLIGFDLKKSPEIIMKAYSDPHGHTRRFNLNHLERINRELGANFNTNQFEHHTEYNPVSGAVKSFLLSNVEQMVSIDFMEQNIHFRKWEPVFMELSRKYDLASIGKLASDHGFMVEDNFYDVREFFVDSLWEKK